jgi:iron complex transport system permease protein
MSSSGRLERASTARVVGALALLVGLALLWGLCVGSAERPSATIVLEIRLPRVLLAGLVGAGLATAGALLQGLMQNPLADPFILGISGGAALGGVFGIALAPALGLGQVPVALFAFGGALAATALLYAVAGGAARAPAHSLLLTGVVFNAFASSLIVFITAAIDLGRVAGVFLWLIGSIRLVEGELLAGAALLVALGIAVGLRDAYALNLLSQGDEVAATLGVEVGRVRSRVLIATALMIGASVAVSGIVGFVGLIVPHLLRLAIGADHRRLVPAVALFGAAFLIGADNLARTVLAPTELPVGAFTSLVGGPLFLLLMRRELGRT